jgi:mannose-6-phosphate isomerase
MRPMAREKDSEDHRPWGWYRVLAEGKKHKVKRITVFPGKRLSLQRHKLRDEHWFVLQGEAVVTRNDEETVLSAGQFLDIPRGVLHRVFNPGEEDLMILEIQTGVYFGEDDIERIEDDFGRR